MLKSVKAGVQAGVSVEKCGVRRTGVVGLGWVGRHGLNWRAAVTNRRWRCSKGGFGMEVQVLLKF